MSSSIDSASFYASDKEDDATSTPANGPAKGNRDSMDTKGPQPSINYGEYSSEGTGLKSIASVGHDGRIGVTFDLKDRLSELPEDLARSVEEFAVDTAKWRDHPAMNIVIMIVGSRGDVQPYVALGKQLKKDGHRIRIASHETFRTFVNEADLEFFNIGGNPHDLMSYMVKNPGLMPGFASLTNGDIPKKRAMLTEMIDGCWQSCHAPCPVTKKAFVADAIISNPPAFAHVHCAEALGIPLLLSFTMPWSPTTAFAHPLVNVTQSNAKPGISNYLTYATSELLQWQGVGDIINKFRVSTLDLPPLSLRSGPGLADRLRVPWTYCMSPALVPKPGDWKKHIDVVGFYFLDLASSFKPPDDLAAFLAAGEPPVYIGFGSIVVDDPAAMSETIFKATEEAGVRALVSAGWGGLGGVSVPPHIFMLGNIPHDWLFDKERVTAVVHHGGAGTTAIGLAKGRPTVVVPFFGDQGFWGSMIHQAGAGPEPIPHKELTIESLRDAIKFAVSPAAKDAAKKLAKNIHDEDGVHRGAESFHKHLPLLNMRCDMDPSRVAVWWSEEHCMKLSAFAAQALVDAKKFEYNSLILHRSKEFNSPKVSGLSVADSATALFWNMTKMGNVIPSSKEKATDLDDDAEVKRTFKGTISSMGGIMLLSANFNKKKGESSPNVSNPTSPYAEYDDYYEKGTGRVSKKMQILNALRDKATETVAKQTGVDLSTLPIHTLSKKKRSPASRAHEQKVRQTRMDDGKDAVKVSSSSQRKLVVRRFEEETLQTPVRRKRRHDTIEKWLREEMDPSNVDSLNSLGETQAGKSTSTVDSASTGTSKSASSVSPSPDPSFHSARSEVSTASNTSLSLLTSGSATPSQIASHAASTPPSVLSPVAAEDPDEAFARDLERAIQLSLEEQ